MEEHSVESGDLSTNRDVISLVFLEFYFSDFSARHVEHKIVTILRRTWKKMSPRGHKAALNLAMPPDVRHLIEMAVSG